MTLILTVLIVIAVLSAFVLMILLAERYTIAVALFGVVVICGFFGYAVYRVIESL